MRDPQFDGYNSYPAMQIIEDIEQLFFFPNLKPVTDITHNFPIREAKLLPAL